MLLLIVKNPPLMRVQSYLLYDIPVGDKGVLTSVIQTNGSKMHRYAPGPI